MDTKSALSIAGKHLQALKGHTFDLLTVTKPISPSAAVNLAKIISKLSPLLGNLIEFNSVEILNDRSDFKGHGAWRRQDPGLDTNFAKMDRIVHPEIEKFKAAVMNMQVHGLTVEEWRTLLASKDEQAICDVLASRLDIKEQAAKALVK